MKRNGALPQKSVKEVFVKSLEGKLLLFSFIEEDTVLDLRNRVAEACRVSVDQFVLVFQSRTLQSSVKIESTGVQRGHTFYMQGALKGRMQRQGLVGEWDCTQCGATRGLAGSYILVFGVASREMVLGTLPRCLKTFEKVKIILCHSLFLFVVREMVWEGLNGIKAQGVLLLVLLRLQLGPTNNNNKGRRNKQEEPLSGPDPMQTLSQVLQLLQTLPLDPSVKDHLRDSLHGHVAPMLQPKKSTAELIHEKQSSKINMIY